MKDSDAEDTSQSYPTGVLIRRLLGLTWTFRWNCLKVIALQLLQLTMGLAGLSLIGLGIDALKLETGFTELQPPWPFGLAPPEAWTGMQVIAAIAGATLLVAVFRFWLNYAAAMAVGVLVHRDVVVRLRDRVYDKLQRLSFRFFDANASGTLINRVTSDVQATRMFIDGVVVQSLIMFLSLVVYMVYMLQIDVALTLICLLPIPFIVLASIIFSKITRPAYAKNRRLMDDLVLNYSENVQAISMLKGFGLEGYAEGRFAQRNDHVRDHRRTIFWKVSTYSPIVGQLTHASLFLVLLVGGPMVIQEVITIGSLVVFASLLEQFSNQVGNLSGIVDNMQQSLTGAKRVFEVLDTEVEVKPPAKPAAIGNVRGEVRFENVQFAYKGDHPVLRDIDFHVRPGQVIAVAGATGAGKSALLSLVPRFYDPDHGRVLIDGIDLRQWPLDKLRRSIGLVFQENFLFSNTIRENIAFGHPGATWEQIEKAARIAQAHDFIMHTSHGYETILGESGINLSGGQRQRLAIARAILLEPPILLLDDPTASIDPETEHEILGAVANAIQGRTTFIVAHRLSTLRRADRILVLREGRIAQWGTHQELMEQEGLYRYAIEAQAIDPESLRLLDDLDRQHQQTRLQEMAR